MGLQFSAEMLDDRRGHDTMSERAFMFVLGLYVVGGLFASSLVAATTYNWHPNFIVLLIIGLGVPIVGIVVSFKSDNWLVSTLGYALVFIPFGALLGPTVALYQLDSVLQVVVATMIVSGIMWVVGTLVPRLPSSWGIYVIGALLVLIAGDLSRLVMVSFGMQPTVLGIWPWVGIVLFSGLIIYDVNQAMQRPKTLDNAVDSAVGIYLDIINLFVRLLEVMGKRKK